MKIIVNPNAIGWLGGAVIAKTSLIEGEEFLLDYQSQEYPWANGPSDKIWMILGPSNKIWIIIGPSNRIWTIDGLICR